MREILPRNTRGTKMVQLALAVDNTAEFDSDLDGLAAALTQHGFTVTRADPAEIDEDGRIFLPLLWLSGPKDETERLGKLLVDFYNDERPVDTTIQLKKHPNADDFDDDQTVDDHIEFELEFLGKDTLIYLPPESIPEDKRKSVIDRYHREFGELAAFLNETSRH